MTIAQTSYSPHILIYLEVGEKRIRLADVLFDSATLFEKVNIAPNTRGTLVLVIDGIEEREDVVLENGVSEADKLVSFSYVDPDRMNGRDFSLDATSL